MKRGSGALLQCAVAAWLLLAAIIALALMAGDLTWHFFARPRATSDCW